MDTELTWRCTPWHGAANLDLEFSTPMVGSLALLVQLWWVVDFLDPNL